MQQKNKLEITTKNLNIDNIPLSFTSSLKSSGINTVSSETKLPQFKTEQSFSKSPQTTKNPLYFTSSPKALGGQQLTPMSKSYMKKDSSQNPQILNFMREIQKKIFKINQTLHHHQQQLNQRQQKITSNIVLNNPNDIQSQIFQRQLINLIRKQVEKQCFRPQNPIMREVQRVRQQLNQISFSLMRKDQSQLMKHRLQNEMYIMKRQINESRDKDKRSLYEVLRKQFENGLSGLQNAVRQNIRKLQIQISQSINKAKDINITSSRKKFYEPKILRYRQIFQRVTDLGLTTNEPPVVINQVMYYLDRDGYLLDSRNNYLIDQDGRQIQLDQKQLDLLRTYGLLR